MAGELRSEFLMELTAMLSGDVHQIGDGGQGGRTIFVVTGGTFEGPHLRGTVAPLGGDWLVRRSDDVSRLDVRALLETDDGAKIHISYGGYNHRQPLGPLGDLPDGERYFRTQPVFETGDERYAWLNRVVAIGEGRSDAPGTVSYRIHAIL